MITSCYINDGDIEKPLLAVFTQDDVEAWGELYFSYSGPVSEEDVTVCARLTSQSNICPFTDDEQVTAVSATQMGKGAVYIPCRCGAPTCKGVLFK